jgi:hypothetical protein
VPLGVVRVCLEHSERDHQTQSDAIRRNQTQSDAIQAIQCGIMIAWIILKAAEDLSTGTQSDAIRRNHNYLDHLEGGRGLVHRYEGRPKRRVPDEGGNQTSSE